MKFNLSMAPIRVLKPGYMGPDVFLVQNALNCHISQFTVLSPSQSANFSLFSKTKADFGLLSGQAKGYQLFPNPGPDYALYPMLGEAGDPTQFPGLSLSCMTMLPYSLWGRQHYMRGVIGGMLRGLPSDVPWNIANQGFYCPTTEQAVKAFQSRCGLTTTGCVDLMTWMRLFPRYRLHLTVPSLLRKPPSFIKPRSASGSSSSSGSSGSSPSPAPGQGQNQAAPKGNNTKPPTPPPTQATQPTDADADDDNRVALTLGVNSDNTVSVEAEFLLAKKKWVALGRELGVKATVDGEMHQPLGSSLGHYGNLKFSVQVEDIWTSKKKLFSLDGFGEAVYQQPSDRGPKNDNDHVLALHAGVDFNVNLPSITTNKRLKPLIPKLTFEGTGGPEYDMEKKSTSPFKLGGELKGTWEF